MQAGGTCSKGIKINIQRSAYMADLTNVKKKFADTINQTEHRLVEQLDDHTHATLDTLHQRKQILESTMHTLTGQTTTEEAMDNEKTQHTKNISWPDVWIKGDAGVPCGRCIIIPCGRCIIILM